MRKASKLKRLKQREKIGRKQRQSGETERRTHTHTEGGRDREKTFPH